jgi:hypothetical protein
LRSYLTAAFKFVEIFVANAVCTCPMIGLNMAVVRRVSLSDFAPSRRAPRETLSG